jgi:hypothetical protein
MYTIFRFVILFPSLDDWFPEYLQIISVSFYFFLLLLVRGDQCSTYFVNLSSSIRSTWLYPLSAPFSEFIVNDEVAPISSHSI